MEGAGEVSPATSAVRQDTWCVERSPASQQKLTVLLVKRLPPGGWRWRSANLLQLWRGRAHGDCTHIHQSTWLTRSASPESVRTRAKEGVAEAKPATRAVSRGIGWAERRRHGSCIDCVQSFECPTKQDGDRAGRGGGERRGGGAGSGGWGGNTQDQGWGSGGGGNETSQNQNWGSGGNDNSAGDGGGWGSMPGGQDSNGKGDIASGNGNKDDGWGAPTPSAKHLKKPETGGWSGQAQPNAQDSRTEAQPSNGGWSSQSQPASSDQINNEGEGGGNAPPVRRPEPQIHPDRLKQVPGGMNSVARNGGRARDADFQRGPIPNRQQPMAQGGDGGWGARQNSQGAGSEPPQAAVSRISVLGMVAYPRLRCISLPPLLLNLLP